MAERERSERRRRNQILKPGRNYGWPIVSYGRTYVGPWQSERRRTKAFEPPIVYWMPAIAVSGMAFYTGDRFPKWKGDVFVGVAPYRRDSGHRPSRADPVQREDGGVAARGAAHELRQRIREVRQGPDGLLYLLTDEKAGAVLRIEPAS